MTVMAKHMRRAAVPEGSAERNRACQRFWVVTAALAAVVALVCELGLFNLLHWTSLSNTPVSLDVQPSAGLTVQGSTYTITDPDNAYLELTGIDAHVSTLFIGLSACDDMALDITVFMTDEANSTIRLCPRKSLRSSSLHHAISNYILQARHKACASGLTKPLVIRFPLARAL